MKNEFLLQSWKLPPHTTKSISIVPVIFRSPVDQELDSLGVWAFWISLFCLQLSSVGKIWICGLLLARAVRPSCLANNASWNWQLLSHCQEWIVDFCSELVMNWHALLELWLCYVCTSNVSLPRGKKYLVHNNLLHVFLQHVLTSIHPFSVTTDPHQGCGRLEPIPADLWNLVFHETRGKLLISHMISVGFQLWKSLQYKCTTAKYLHFPTFQIPNFFSQHMDTSLSDNRSGGFREQRLIWNSFYTL